jgi:hypothetical protein
VQIEVAHIECYCRLFAAWAAADDGDCVVIWIIAGVLVSAAIASLRQLRKPRPANCTGMGSSTQIAC